MVYEHINVYSVHLKGTFDIRIDRKSKYGNPFYMKDESERDLVCDKFEEYIKTKPELIDDLVVEVLALNKSDIKLGCWCYPKRCHGSTLARLVMERINK
jgi:hypothetical protein